MSSRVIRVTEMPGGMYMAITHLDRLASSPELAVRLAGAASLNCEPDEVLVSGQAHNLYVVSRGPKPALKIEIKVDARAGRDALSAVCAALDAEQCLDKCHGSEVAS